ATGYRIFNTSDLKVIVDGGTAGVDPVSINTIGVLAGLEMLNPSAEINWETVTDNGKLDDAVEKLVYGEDSVLNSFVAALKAGDAEAIRANNERSVVRNNEFRAAADEMIQQQIRVGAAQARVDRSVQRTEDLKLSVSTALSNEVDTDFAESTMEVQKAKALLEAAQSITATIGSMNLFQRGIRKHHGHPTWNCHWFWLCPGGLCAARWKSRGALAADRDVDDFRISNWCNDLIEHEPHDQADDA
ncbi:MAG: hypothetical protein EBS61_10885, partial [Betaproteobacteria bacterium]|nr:hypothetical protein [Betaproteobacteria bacterium]